MSAFADAVRRVAEGGSALDPEIVRRLMTGTRSRSAVEELTARERAVLALMAEGRSNLGVAQRLVITERAVQKHVSSIFLKLGLPPAPEDHRRVLAVLMQLGAINPAAAGVVVPGHASPRRVDGTRG